MTDVKDDSLALREQLESLPQELYDFIYKLTFTADSRVRCLAQKNQSESSSSFYSQFGPSDDFSATFDVRLFPQDPLLYVNRASRNLYAASYFNSVGIVSVAGESSKFDRLKELNTFLSILPADFRPMISELRLHIERGPWYAYDTYHHLFCPRDKWRVRQRWDSDIADKLVWVYLGGKGMYC